ncbi:MAG: UTP--glucose-1-phosphate uridylyltransferase [Kofleriaceae bacterium]
MKTLAEAETALARYGYDPSLQQQFAARARVTSENAVTGTLAPLADGDIPALPALGSNERRALRAKGLELIMARKVGAVVLAGGMATRFGGVVKAVVPADGERSFFRCKLDDVRAMSVAAGAPIPMFVMSSFATHDALVAHVTNASHVRVFPQFVALRLRPDGELFRAEGDELSPYATGHGDLTFALRTSGALAQFRDAGGTTLLVSNVDNLAATLDPAIIGLHAELGGAITAEVVRKVAGDKGGAPALLDGTPQIIEGFRFAPTFDQSSIGVFNTNTLVMDAAAIDRDFALTYYRVEKQVDGSPAIQFERLVGELTATLPTRFVEVPRSGEDARFLPVKDPEELDRSRAAIADVLSSQRSLHG